MKVCEHYVACGFWSIAATGSESLVKIGFEYGRSVTGEELNVNLDYEEHNETTPDSQDEETTIDMSNEVYCKLLKCYVHLQLLCGIRYWTSLVLMHMTFLRRFI